MLVFPLRFLIKGTMEEIERQDTARFLRRMFSEESLRCHGFIENLITKGLKSGCIRVEHNDGTVDEYNIRADDDDMCIVAFCEGIFKKRAETYQRLLKEL